MPEILDDVAHCVDAVLRRVGPRVVLALPLGIGKPNPLVNEFYRRAARGLTIDLAIITALSLLKPVAHSALERRLAGPLAQRIFGSYVEPEYAHALKADTLPPSIRIIEFFLSPGRSAPAPPRSRTTSAPTTLTSPASYWPAGSRHRAPGRPPHGERAAVAEPGIKPRRHPGPAAGDRGGATVATSS